MTNYRFTLAPLSPYCRGGDSHNKWTMENFEFTRRCNNDEEAKKACIKWATRITKQHNMCYVFLK